MIFETPFNGALYSGHIDVVRMLISKGADFNAVYKDWATALMSACSANRL